MRFALCCSKKVLMGQDYLVRDVLKVNLPSPVQLLWSIRLINASAAPSHACQHRCVSRQ